MPITFAAPPRQVAELTQRQLQEMAQHKHFTIAPLAAAEPGKIQIDSGHPVYNIGLHDLLSNKPITAAPFTAWRFIVNAGTPDSAAAETLQDPEQGIPTFASVNAGPFVTGTIEALSTLATDPAFTKGDWEGRMIRIPALYVMAIWAHEKKTGVDLIRPIPPIPPYLAAKTYTWPDFKAALREPAQQKLTNDADTKG
ncbi:MAG TPA: hypothetical protein VNY78_05095 [Edaphobacter sp.]|nr:hypothetical protein [Edaphobacter sp.]